MNNLLVLALGIAARAFGLPMVKSAITKWAGIFPLFAGDRGKQHMDEFLSIVHEQIEDSREQRYSPDSTALQVLVSWVKGAPWDIVWCAPFIPKFLADKTGAWAKTLAGVKIPNIIIAAITTMGLFNWSFFSASNQPSFIQWLVINCSIVFWGILFWKQKTIWAQRIFKFIFLLMGVFMVGFLGWITIHFKFYQSPMFGSMLIGFVAIGLMMLGIDKENRKHWFKGSWWRVIIYCLAIIGISLATSWTLSGSVIYVLSIWAMFVILGIGIVGICLVFSTVASIICYGGIRGSALGLKLIASGLQRLR